MSKETKDKIIIDRDILRRQYRMMKGLLREARDEIITLRIQNRLYLQELKKDASE